MASRPGSRIHAMGECSMNTERSDPFDGEPHTVVHVDLQEPPESFDESAEMAG
jgi:hypothetical protein